MIFGFQIIWEVGLPSISQSQVSNFHSALWAIKLCTTMRSRQEVLITSLNKSALQFKYMWMEGSGRGLKYKL